MSTVKDEIAALEERLWLAELGPDPNFFEEALADEAVLISDGQPALAKAKVVEAHKQGHGPKFTQVQMSNMKIVDHGLAAVVTCQGAYEGATATAKLRFMRVWVKKDGRWQIIAEAIWGS